LTFVPERKEHLIGMSHIEEDSCRIGILINFNDCSEDFLTLIISIKSLDNLTDEEKFVQFDEAFRLFIEQNEILLLFRHNDHDMYNGANTTGDGLCGYRALYQLYNRQIYQSTSNLTTIQLNQYCNAFDPNLLDSNFREPFVEFLTNLLNINTSSEFEAQINTVLTFINTTVATHGSIASMPSSSGAWMHGDRLPLLMTTFNTTGSFLSAINTTSCFKNLGIVMGSNITHERSVHMLTYSEIINILNGGFITYKYNHFGVERVSLDSRNDIQEFENCLNDLINKMFQHYFIHDNNTL
jgi:hypothetical protein